MKNVDLVPAPVAWPPHYVDPFLFIITCLAVLLRTICPFVSISPLSSLSFFLWLCFLFFSLWSSSPLARSSSTYVPILQFFCVLIFFHILPRISCWPLCFFSSLNLSFYDTFLFPHFSPFKSSCLLNPTSKPHLIHLSFARPSCFPLWGLFSIRSLSLGNKIHRQESILPHLVVSDIVCSTLDWKC